MPHGALVGQPSRFFLPGAVLSGIPAAPMMSHIQQLALLLASQEAPPGGCGADTLNQLGPLFLMIPIFYFLVIGPARREKKNHQQMVESLKRGDEVITNSGIVGTIADFDEPLVVIEVAKGVKLRLLKSSIATRYTPKKVEIKKDEAKA